MASRPPKALQLQIHVGRWPKLGAYLKRQMPKAVALTRTPLKELSVVLIGDAAMSRLHQQFFNDPSTTDVITFPLDLNTRGQALSGELYLCVPMARREARSRNISLEHELLLYGLHGVLHLGGHDDTNAAGFAAMHRKEDTILKRLGIGAVFARECSLKK